MATILLPMVLLVPGPLVVKMLGRGRVITSITTTEVGGGLGLVIEGGLDGLLTRGVLRCDI